LFLKNSLAKIGYFFWGFFLFRSASQGVFGAFFNRYAAGLFFGGTSIVTITNYQTK
jgi:hypothetical protein